MASVNRAFVLGRLGQDPELRYTPNQTPVVTLNVATTEAWSKDGQKQETTEWHRIVVWGKQAENCNKYLKKGSAVHIDGRIQTRSWEDKSGQKRFTTEIIANNVQFIGGGSGAGSAMGQGGGDYPPPADPGYGGGSSYQNQGMSSPPQFAQAERSQPSSFGATSADIDDIPF